MRRPEWCLFPQNFNGTVATYCRVCQVANLGPVPEKKFVLSYLLLSSRPRVYRSLGKSLERPFSLFGPQPDKFPSLSRPSFPFFLDYSVSLLRVENFRTHLQVLDFSFCRQSLRSVFLRLSRASIVTVFTSPPLSLGHHQIRDLGEVSCTPTQKLSGSPFRCRSCRLCTLEPQLVRKFRISGSHELARPPKKDLTPTE
jgi:hypothetical protein